MRKEEEIRVRSWCLAVEIRVRSRCLAASRVSVSHWKSLRAGSG